MVILHCKIEQQKKAKNLVVITVETKILLVKEQKKAMGLADTTYTKDSTTTKAFLRASVNARAQDRQRVLPLPVVHHVSCVLSTKSLQEISNSSSHCSYSRLDSQQESTNFYK